MKAKELITELNKYASPKRANNSAWFFKTGPGQYGEGDQFTGVDVPTQRKISKPFVKLSLIELDVLFSSQIHEHRLCAVFILIDKYKIAGNLTEQTRIYKYYLDQLNKGRINNWDIVDSSAHKIVGAYLLDKPRLVLIDLAKSNKLWHQRVAIIATYCFISHGQFKDTFLIAGLLINHPADLIHKAVGWMLREIGKRDQKSEEYWLKQNYKLMPRTMLRYAIEKFPEQLRQDYLKSRV